MKSQQAAEREEQQRIKNLVLNYDLREDDNYDGIANDLSPNPLVKSPLEENPNTKGLQIGSDHYNHSLTRAEKSGRHAPRSRRLNLSDVDWYGTRQSRSGANENEPISFSRSRRSKHTRHAKKLG